MLLVLIPYKGEITGDPIKEFSLIINAAKIERQKEGNICNEKMISRSAI